MTPEEMKAWIDKSSYEQLLSHWRFAPAGDSLFTGEIGDYYKEKMTEKRSKVSDEEAVRASKSIGWRQ